MFDLDKALESWRSSLPAEIRQHREHVEELEQHLRDSFEERTRDGAAPDAAWAAAVASLGSAGQLAREFGKLDRSARAWIPVSIAACGMIVIVIRIVLDLDGRMRSQPLLATHVALVITGYCAVFAVGFFTAFAILSRALIGWEEPQHRAVRRIGGMLSSLSVAATAPGVILGAVWAHQHMGRWWGWDPKEIGGMCVLAWGVILFKSFVSRTTAPQMLMALGVIGNAVVAISWFGPVLTAQSHSYGNGTSLVGALLGAFLIVQMGLVYLALLPPRVLRREKAGA